MIKTSILLSTAALLSVAAFHVQADAIPHVEMPKNFVGSPCSSSPAVPTGGKTYYVSPTGNDANNGLTTGAAFKTVAHAFKAYKVRPGDVVLVASGTYAETVTVNTAGTPGNCIALMGMPGQTPPVITWNKDSSATINVWAPYVRISGLYVTHPEPNFKPNSTNNTGNTAIDIYSSIAADANGVQRPTVHHVQVDNNVTYGSGCGGVSAEGSDYLLFYGNTSYGNAFSDPGQCSGLSVYEPVNLDSASGYHIIVMDNFSYANQNIQPAYGHTYTTDGNGVIIDDSRQTQRTQPAAPALPVAPYSGATLVYGNVTFGNGGRGVNIYASDDVDVINNVTYQNLADTKLKNYPNAGGELNAAASGNIVFQNNAAVAALSTLPVMAQSGTSADQASNLWNNNIADVGKIALGAANSGNADATRLYGVDPGFRAPSLAPADAATNFRLLTNSAALNAGQPFGLAVTDAGGNWIAAGATESIGGYLN